MTIKINIDTWIRTKKELKALAKELEIRPDWHEADTWGIETQLVAGTLDNAFGDTSEAHVILIADPDDNPSAEPRTYGINLANLLAWGSRGV